MIEHKNKNFRMKTAFDKLKVFFTVILKSENKLFLIDHNNNAELL